MILQAIKVSQPLGDFYIAKIKATDLLSISTSSVARYDKDGVLRGNQRPLDPPRLRLIANFIKSQEMSFPTSILVAANINQQGNIIEAPDSRWSIEETIISNVYTITVPDGVTTCLIIDGQHRLNAFKCVDKDFQEIELVCSIFIDLPNPYQAYLFATINGNQKKLTKVLHWNYLDMMWRISPPTHGLQKSWLCISHVNLILQKAPPYIKELDSHRFSLIYRIL